MHNITLKTAGRNEIVSEQTVANGEVHLIGFINECPSHEGPANWHSAIEAWDVRDAANPVFLHRDVVHPNDEYHHAEPEARALVAGRLENLVNQGNSADLEPGEFVKILVDTEERENAEAGGGLLSNLLLMALASLLEDADDDDDDGEDLPGAFGGFNPFLN